MPELPDQRFDAAITRALKFDPLVTPRQYENAKERVLHRAAVHTVLPPLQSVETRTLRDHASVVYHRTLRLLNLLIVDSTAYERARRPLPLYQFYNAHGRYSFTILHVSA